VDGLLIDPLQLALLVALLEAGDEDDDCDYDTDDDGSGGGDDDVVEALGSVHAFGTDLPALLEGHVGWGDFYFF